METNIIAITADIMMHSHLSTIALSLGLKLLIVTSIQELFVLLHTSSPNMLIFDLKQLNDEKTEVYDIVSMMNTYTRGKRQDIPISVVVRNSDRLVDVENSISSGIRGIIPDPTWVGNIDTTTAINEVLCGKTYFPAKLLKLYKATANTRDCKLTGRQEQINRLICDYGASNKIIAKKLNISESTVKIHVTAILKKFGVRNRTQLAVFSKR